MEIRLVVVICISHSILAQINLVNSISVFHFGALENGIADDADAFQKAIAYCIEKQKTLYVTRTSNVIISRI